jgi:hypothetical protein
MRRGAPLKILFFACVLAMAVTAAPARAGDVIVVDGKHAVRKDDPFVPARSAIALRPAPARTGAAAVASAAGGPRAYAARPKRGPRAVARALKRERSRRHISAGAYRRYTRDYRRARKVLRRLRGARKTQLAYVVASVERLALSRRLTRTRLPASFLQLRRNTQYWPSLPYPAVGQQVTFTGSEILFQYFPGEGLQIHPLSTFKKANLIHGACTRGEPTCDEDALRRLLDEMTSLAVRRSRHFIAWEYLFYFGGGYPPWISGMAEATAIQAYGRAADLLNEPSYRKTAERALPVFRTPPPTGVRTTGPNGGVTYLQYSFAPRLYIFNAFLQSLIGLYDYWDLTGNTLAKQFFDEAEPEAEAQVPESDVGDWSLYNYRGHESSRDYHELLREFLASMCSRRLGRVYCEYADKYRGYQTDPPVLRLEGPDLATEGRSVRIAFSVSKLSAVELQIYRAGRLRYDRIATYRRGDGSFVWKPNGPGVFTVRIAAKELRTGLGLKDRDEGEIEVENAPG